MKRSVIPVLLLVLALLVCGCAAKSDSVNYAPAAPAEAPAAAYEEAGLYRAESAAYDSEQSAAQSQPADAGMRKIIYNADLRLTADDPAAALEAIVQKAISLGGYVANSYTSNDDFGAYRATASLKVPADSLSALVSAAEETGTVDSYSLSSDDISLSYYDVQARLGSAQAEEKQLLEMLEKCETVEDLLAVRAQLADVRADIESYQAQIKLWDNLVDYATLSLSINRVEKTPVEGEGSLIAIWKASDVWKNISRGFSNSARFAVNAIAAIGIFIAYAFIPAAILFCCIGLPIILRRRKKKKRAAAETKPDGTPPQA